MSSKQRGYRSLIITQVKPEVDHGAFPIKRCVNGSVTVEADIFTDGHDEVQAQLQYRHERDASWSTIAMTPLENDRFQATFEVQKIGIYEYTLMAWIDDYTTWHHDLAKRVQANQDITVDLFIGIKIIQAAARRANEKDAHQLRQFVQRLKQTQDKAALNVAQNAQLKQLMIDYPHQQKLSHYSKSLLVRVDRPLAYFSAWYELFPRSWSGKKQQHGTFKDIIKHLPYVAKMGFNVIYFPPIHPIGHKFRKGKNNILTVSVGDPGSPWAIGSLEGGHKSIHRELGTLDDFHQLVKVAKNHQIEIALDFALQCSADHPYLTEHPEWFVKRPDGTIQYAENPPKKYQDIYPLNFQTKHWKALWQECADILKYWIAQGVTVFRVDNPHTKPFNFWEWLIKEIKNVAPEVIFLAEAFTRPKVMYHLAKLGFTQSYTYFTWRNTKEELTTYFEELTKTEVKEYFHPNLWPNTPDILHHYLQKGERPAFMTRLVLAATLSSNYGIYGPAFELCEYLPQAPDSEEYKNSEKYEMKEWNLDSPDSLAATITRINKIRQNNSALQKTANLYFHKIENDQLLCYSKKSKDNVILVIVNLDPQNTQSGFCFLNLKKIDLGADKKFIVHDLLNEVQYQWQGSKNYVELNADKQQAHIFLIKDII